MKRTILVIFFDYLNKAQVENSKSALRLLTHNMAVIQPSFTMHGQNGILYLKLQFLCQNDDEKWS